MSTKIISKMESLTQCLFKGKIVGRATKLVSLFPTTFLIFHIQICVYIITIYAQHNKHLVLLSKQDD